MAGWLRVPPFRGPSSSADVAQRMLARFHPQRAGAMQVVPLRLVLAAGVEDLHPMVLAVGDVDPAVGVAADVVHDVELARTAAGLSPGAQQLAVWRVLVHARVAIAVRHVDLAAGRERGVGAAVEWIPAHIGRRLAGHAQLQEQLALRSEFAHGMVAVVAAVEHVVGADVQAVGVAEHPLPPGPQKVPLAVEHDHRVGAAIEYIDAVLPVHRDGAGVAHVPALRQVAPVHVHFVAKAALTEHRCHLSPLL